MFLMGSHSQERSARLQFGIFWVSLSVCVFFFFAFYLFNFFFSPSTPSVSRYLLTYLSISLDPSLSPSIPPSPSPLFLHLYISLLLLSFSIYTSLSVSSLSPLPSPVPSPSLFPHFPFLILSLPPYCLYPPFHPQTLASGRKIHTSRPSTMVIIDTLPSLLLIEVRSQALALDCDCCPSPLTSAWYQCDALFECELTRSRRLLAENANK